MNKLEYRKNKVRNGNFYLYNKNKVNKEMERRQKEEMPEIEELEEVEEDLYEELMDELQTIKRKKTLERFVKENRDLINELNVEQKGKILQYIRERFY